MPAGKRSWAETAHAAAGRRADGEAHPRRTNWPAAGARGGRVSTAACRCAWLVCGGTARAAPPRGRRRCTGLGGAAGGGGRGRGELHGRARLKTTRRKTTPVPRARGAGVDAGVGARVGVGAGNRPSPSFRGCKRVAVFHSGPLASRPIWSTLFQCRSAAIAARCWGGRQAKLKVSSTRVGCRHAVDRRLDRAPQAHPTRNRRMDRRRFPRGTAGRSGRGAPLRCPLDCQGG